MFYELCLKFPSYTFQTMKLIQIKTIKPQDLMLLFSFFLWGWQEMENLLKLKLYSIYYYFKETDRL